MATVTDAGGAKRLADMLENIRAGLTANILPSVAAVMAAEASGRAPSPEVEYETMTTGDGNPEGISRVPPMPLSMSDTDGDGKRLRFYKPESMYLQNVIVGSYRVDGLLIGVGNIQQLNAASTYEWRNVTGDVYSTNFPFWSAWEGGIDGSFYVSPKNFSGKSIPTLKPGIGKENQRYFMYKSIPAVRMFSGINVDKYIQQIILPAVREIAQQS